MNDLSVLSVFCGVFFFLGLAVLVQWIREISGAISASYWEATPCEIIETRVLKKSRLEKGHSHSFYTPEICFEYQVRGETYSSSTYQSLYETTFSTPEKCQEFIDQFPKGSTTECFVNPANPGQAVFENGIQESYFGPLCLALLFMGGSSLSYFKIIPWLQTL